MILRKCVFLEYKATIPFSFSPLLSSFLNERESSTSLWSEYADPLCETLHICILPAVLVIGSLRRRRRHKVSRVWQSMFTGVHLPAAVIALVGNVTFPELSLQFPQVEPRLIVLGNDKQE